MELLLKYFPELDEKQKEQFAALDGLYTDWNAKINVISRKDIGNLYEHHVLHSLGIAKVIRFQPGTTVMDLGGQHRQESTCGVGSGTQHRADKRHLQPRTGRGG